MLSKKTILVMLSISFLLSCKNGETGRHGRDPDNDQEQDQRDAKDDDDDDRGCGVEDGTQTARVDYYNPETGYDASYTLNVEVENCQVVQIDFNNGGYLDEDHIEPADIDEDGDASIEDDRGRSFEVHIDK